uniref:Neuronal acetylcholine receptor subunit alpha-7 n=1 Tax=Macrostomum lignano TaxID=282301 RepID=A0A1I8H0I3_9PLAT
MRPDGLPTKTVISPLQSVPVLERGQLDDRSRYKEITGYHERRLLYYLFHPNNRSSALQVHNPVERPVRNDSGVLYVWFKVSLQQIIDVDEKNQILFANIWLDLTWNDYHFVWDPKDFGDITKINIDPRKVWRPDILLYNSADEKFDGTYPTNVVIEHTGNMNFIPPGMFRSTCKIDTTWFPFDTQICKLKFGSWSYDGGTLDLRLKCSNESLDTTEKRLSDPQRCSEVGQADLETYITSGERTLYYGINLIIPCVLISTMSLLTFLLPPDAGEKISLGVMIMLSLSMFQLLVADSMPKTSEAVPLIVMYFTCTMVMCSLSVVFTVIVLNYHHRDAESHPVPRWVKKFICTYLANILCMKNHRQEEAEQEFIRLRRPKNFAAAAAAASAAASHRGASFRDTAGAAGLPQRHSKSLLANVLDLENGVQTVSGGVEGGCGVGGGGGGGGGGGNPNGLSVVLDELRIVTRKIADDTTASDISSDWKFAARVVDRLCLIVFSCFTVISTCSILFSAPDVYKG